VGKLLAVALASLWVSGCLEPEEPKTGGAAYELEMLFEHDGCRVYRFDYYGRSIFYTDCRGSTDWEQRAHKRTLKEHVETVR
jgi:hypothetical protein